jgi:hypothetical protein
LQIKVERCKGKNENFHQQLFSLDLLWRWLYS